VVRSACLGSADAVSDRDTVIVLKRSMRPGFAGVDNDLYYNENCMMLFGDARDSLTKLFTALK
jgi:NAD(P) transhydrogenase subunit beta